MFTQFRDDQAISGGGHGFFFRHYFFRLYHIDYQELHIDEIFTSLVAVEGPRVVLSAKMRVETNPPLYYGLQALLTPLGTDRFALRLLPAFSGIATIPVLYLLAQRLCGTRAALLAAATFALSPMHIYYSRWGRCYSSLMLACTATLLCFSRLLPDALFAPPRHHGGIGSPPPGGRTGWGTAPS